MSRFEVRQFDFSTATERQMAEIKAVYDHAFTVDIGIEFDASLDSDFTTPLQYYGKDVRGAFFVVIAVGEKEADGSEEDRIVGTAGIRAIQLPASAWDERFPVEARDVDAAPKHESLVCELKRMFTLPVARGRGTGRALLEAVLLEARRLGYRAMVLDTKKKLAAANALYERSGFADCENYNGNERADRFMMMAL